MTNSQKVPRRVFACLAVAVVATFVAVYGLAVALQEGRGWSFGGAGDVAAVAGFVVGVAACVLGFLELLRFERANPDWKPMPRAAVAYLCALGVSTVFILLDLVAHVAGWPVAGWLWGAGVLVFVGATVGGLVLLATGRRRVEPSTARHRAE